ncbi:hypothetical protein [Candidatus Nitrotoga sp. M5]|nr:hypothetical protein [Candidatus Nitrotoga sp. M5]CAH1385452.1 hypothetical protein NTGM5_120100 [Candidatus Nitrotoga sp. M5]
MKKFQTDLSVRVEGMGQALLNANGNSCRSHTSAYVGEVEGKLDHSPWTS